MIYRVRADGHLDLGGRIVRCALGARGVTPAGEKREGDGASPLGVWPLRRLLWRADRKPLPATRLPAMPLHPDDGWCDDPADAAYNRPVKLPYEASAERLWRDDHLYDLLVVLGHNDDPVRPGAGSAIFLHLASPDFDPTRGCVALQQADMLDLLGAAARGDSLEITAEPCAAQGAGLAPNRAEPTRTDVAP